MIYIIGAVISAGISLAVAILMAKHTNRLIADRDLGENIPGYTRTVGTMMALAAIVVISGVCGYQICRRAVSVGAMLELMCCYYAILAAAITDWKTKIIPDQIPLALLGARLVLFVLELLTGDGNVSELVRSLLSGIVCMVALIVIGNLGKNGIGGGDIKLLAAVAFMTNLMMLMQILMFAFLSCAAVGILAILAKKMTFKSAVAFAPFMYLGFVLMCVMI